jgi:hypothetical protein
MKPCASCPWRVGVVGARDIPGWGPELAAGLAQSCRDDGFAIMACHKSREGAEIPCAGYLAVVGYDSIGARILSSSTKRDIVAEAQADAEGTDLHPDFEAMLQASGVPVPPRNRSPYEGSQG